MTTKIFAIRNKLTGEFLSFGSKVAWASVGAAKSAFANHTAKGVYFDDPDAQEVYEIVDLTAVYEESQYY